MQQPIKEVPVSFTRHYKQVEHTCPVCGETFQAGQRAVYCSLRCRSRAGWARNGAKTNAQRRKHPQKEG